MKQTILVTDVSLNATIISLETFSIIHKKAISSKEASIRSETFLSHWTCHKIWSQTLQPTAVSRPFWFIVIFCLYLLALDSLRSIRKKD